MPTLPQAALAELQTLRRALLVVDLVESVRLIQEFESEVIDRWRRFVAEARSTTLPRHAGRMVKHLGDGMLVEFEQAKGAVAAAFELRALIRRLNDGAPPQARLALRAGAHVGEVQADDMDLFGHSVNLAARLAGLALPDTLVVSAELREELISGLDAELEDLGECWIKHLPQPVRAYRAEPPPDAQRDPSDRAAPRAARMPRSPGTPAAVTSLLPRLAVLDLNAAPADAALGALVADELARLLTVQRQLELVSRLSTRGRTPPGRDPLALLGHLRVDYGLAGSCRCSGAEIEVVLELLTVGANTVMWSGVHRGPLAELLSAPADVLAAFGAEVLRAIRAHETRRANALPVTSLESYALLIGGVNLMHRLSRTSFERGHELLEAVAERMPRHPEAHAWLAKWHLMQAFQGWSADPRSSSSRADDAARRALDLDADCSLALTAAGMVQTYGWRRLDEGERLYRQALAVNPNDALAWLLKGALHGFRGEGPQALDDAHRALALSPADPMQYYFEALAASAAVSAGEYDEAVLLAERSLRANSLHASTLRVLAIAHELRGSGAAARDCVERMLALEPGFTVRRFLERAPGADYPIGKRFAEALRSAGVPD